MKLLRNLVPGIFQGNYRYKWIPSEGEYCVDYSKLKNYNSTIVGSSGYGKSTVAKKIVSKLNANYIIFDIHGEYSDIPGERIDVSKTSINPLSLFGKSPKQRSLEVATMLKSIFNLGSLQTMEISNLLLEAYEEKGIYEEDPDSWLLRTPNFRDLIILIEKKKSLYNNSQMINRLEGLESYIRFLDSNIFNSDYNFNKIFNNKIILDFSNISVSYIKYILIESILNLIFSRFNEEKSDKLRNLIVIDEAPFILSRESGRMLVDRIFAEGRKFGYGTMIISQYSKELDKVINNSAIVLSLGMREPSELEYMSKVIGGEHGEAQRTVYEMIMRLERGLIATRDLTTSDVIVFRLN
ncbi:ATP-binding protein [Metallosphaera tengchongensis]|nr:DUF87 domain-containing protein [Metallosphaera tengchongensis]